MPNFQGTQFGLISRISTRPSAQRPLYGIARNDVHFEAIPLHYDSRRFLGRFLKRWPEGSPARASYFRRILKGPEFTVAEAQPSARLSAA
jgi:hypothetical protein